MARAELGALRGVRNRMESRRPAAPPFIWIPFALAAFAGGIAAAAAPGWAVLAILAIVLGFAFVFHPLSLAALLGFLAAAVPKAGFRVGDFPVPVLLFGVVIAALALRLNHRHTRRDPATVMVALAAFAWIAFRAVQFADEGISTVAAFVAWTAVPLFIVLVCANLIDVATRFRRAIEAGFVVSVVYAIVQVIFGIEEVAVEGLTYAYGDDLRVKNNALMDAAGRAIGISKIPSTYQGGNNYGVVAAIFLALAMQRILRDGWRAREVVVAVAALVAVTLSGSRTAVVAAAVMGLVILVRSGVVGRKVAAGLLAGIGAGAVLLARPGLLDRYSVDLIVDTGGSGRWSIWSATWAELSASEWLFGVNPRFHPEGWAGMVCDLGLIGIAIFAAAYVLMARSRPEFRVVFIGLAVAAVVDSTFLVFPTWFLPALMTAEGGRGPDSPKDGQPPSSTEADLPAETRL